MRFHMINPGIQGAESQYMIDCNLHFWLSNPKKGLHEFEELHTIITRLAAYVTDRTDKKPHLTMTRRILNASGTALDIANEAQPN